MIEDDIKEVSMRYELICEEFINSNFKSSTIRPHNTKWYRKLNALLMANNNNQYDSNWWKLEKITNKHNNKNTCTLVRSNLSEIINDTK